MYKYLLKLCSVADTRKNLKQAKKVMAAGVIKNMSDFKLVPTFQLPMLNITVHQDMDFQETSEEEEEFEDDSEDRESESVTKCIESENWTPACLSFNPIANNTDTTLQLLRFTELINNDIQKYFGRKNKDDDPDACNIYEDRFSSGKSGRELYYADLIRIAQDGDQEEDESHVHLTSPRDIDIQALKLICDKESIKKLGPLAELFEYGLHKYMKQTIFNRRDSKRQRLDRKYANVIPMHNRRLPLSFWREPISAVPCCVLHTCTPDFSDLLANWTSESSGQELQVTREISTEINRQSMESESYQVV
ncbi:protein PERCC1 [Hemiscyllium ocellatum]|uniref:protein PERCC1 n=1 Tax=Hemiscyllium ocellatum TaxID=170820 RepID=UPI002966931E|nr:protein PERCC1 [Hemiscyllium ocellatum]